MIEVSDLRKHYGRIRAVDGISFSVARGEVVGFLGPNAAGKTTTMRILTCFLAADGGRASVAGYDVETQPTEVRRRIGYLPENNPLYLDMEVTEYLRFIATVRGIPSAAQRVRIDGTVERCGLGAVRRRPIGSLSKGYRQRVGLAQTLVHDPEVLILDEPTTGLDPNQIVEIRELIKGIGREKTIILSSHILPEVEATCERIVIINEGRIAGVGTAVELSRQARGAEIVRLLVRGLPADMPASLTAIAGVISIRDEGQEDGARRLCVTAGIGSDPRAELFHLAVREGWTIVEIYREEACLEDVFRQLTSGEAVHA